MYSKVNQLYVNYPGLGLGIVLKRFNKVAKIGIVSTGETKAVAVKSIKKMTIPQTITIDQIGQVRLYEYIKVRTTSESYILQLLRISDEGCTFAKFWQDSGICRNGVLVLDSNDFLHATSDVMKMSKLTALPSWMAGRVNGPILRFKRQQSKHLNKKIVNF